MQPDQRVVREALAEGVEERRGVSRLPFQRSIGRPVFVERRPPCIAGDHRLELFDPLLGSGIHCRYAERFLKPDQIDEVEIADYLGGPPSD